LKRLTPRAARAALAADPRLIVPVGTIAPHGTLPLGTDSLIVDRLADDLSAEFQVLRAPTIEYGVNTLAAEAGAGSTTVRRKTLHRFLNDLLGAWEKSGVEQFIILTAHGHDAHQEALSTLHTRHARVRAVDVFALPLDDADQTAPERDAAVDESLLLHLCPDISMPEAARDPRASAERGARLYSLIYQRIAARVLAE
jgi:creatinine amidohydrolase